MRFHCGPSIWERLNTWATERERRRAAKMLWHPWFAWRPVRMIDGECVWLEKIQRRVNYYRALCGGACWAYAQAGRKL